MRLISRRLIGLAFILLACAGIYNQGLHSIFILDDADSFSALQLISAEDPIHTIITYTLNGVTGGIGRPLSYLSFALQWQSWPNDPFNFKLVNLLIHLINGSLIYLLSRQILALTPARGREVLPLIITALWLLHPIQASTVLYAVQRMTELSALFTLFGLLLYLHGRLHLTTSSLQRRYLTMTVGLGLGLLLGILSKENAILLCLYILVLEATVLKPIQRPEFWNLWAITCLVLPLVALVIYLLPNVLTHAFTPYPTRSFTSLQRLVMESHVLVDYLYNIVLPRPNSFGLLHSNYNVTLLSVATLIKSALLLSLLTLAWRLRKRLPLISMGVLWFFAGHVLESTALNLEPYFEHRNYLSLWGILMTLAGIFIPLKDKLKERGYALASLGLSTGAILWAGVVIAININEVKLWGNPLQQAAVWADAQADSPRAQGHLAERLILLGRMDDAGLVFQRTVASHPKEINMLLNWLELTCFNADIKAPEKTELLRRIATGNFENEVFSTLRELLDLKSIHQCPTVDDERIIAILQALLDNPNYRRANAQINIHLLFTIQLHRMKAFEQVIMHLREAFKLRGTPDILLDIADNQLARESIDDYTASVSELTEFCATHEIQCLPYESAVISHKKRALSLLTREP
jgi:hypothetical protein